MRCAALFGGRPERGAAGLANNVRSSHGLIGDKLRCGPDGVWVCTLFLAVEARQTKSRGEGKPRPTTRTDRFVTNLAGMRPDR